MDRLNQNILCKTCGSSLTHHVSVPSSPVPHLHRTLQAPDQSILGSIQEMLSHARTDLSELDDEIVQMQAVLDELRIKRNELQKFTSEHEGFLAPIRLLPVEILTEIFALCMPEWGTPSFSTRQAPLVLGQVCVGWRRAAASVQNLWSSITVSFTQCPNEALAMAWLSRATSAPLSILLDAEYYQHPSTKKMWPAISQLVQYCDRWKHIEISLPSPMLLRLYPVRHRLPWLESLRISRQDLRHHFPLALDIFDFAPRLQILRIDSHISLERLKVPWNQLTELDAHYTSVTACLSTLQLVPNLVKCRMHCDSWVNPTDSILSHPMPILRFQHLQSLCIDMVGNPVDLVDHLELTVLRDVHIIYDYGISQNFDEESWLSQQPFISFLSRSSHTLRSLVITSELAHGLPRPILTKCLRATPSLVELKVGGVHGWFTADTLDQLTCQTASVEVRNYLVPELEVLEIGESSINPQLLADMIESRWRVAESDGTVARLQNVRFELEQPVEEVDGIIRNPTRFDAETLDRLRSYQHEGMNISVVDVQDGSKDLLKIHPT
jgi:hypothetical protein